jgi:ABC-2 type transport system permease protein
MFFFLSRLVGEGIAGQLEPYGGNYFSFVLIGVAFTDYLSVSLSSFAGQIRSAQMQGTLEAMRQILLNGATLAAVYDKALILALFTVLLLPLGLAAFGYGLRMARKEGSLIHY